jgi:hypothetical protein
MAVMALFMTKSSKAAEGDQENGLAGNAPCLDSYVGVWENTSLGYDPHAVHGILAKDGGNIAVGMSNESESSSSKDGFIIKT